jgi:hypothetical protein
MPLRGGPKLGLPAVPITAQGDDRSCSLCCDLDRLGIDMALWTLGPKRKSLGPRPQVSRDYPPNLSI